MKGRVTYDTSDPRVPTTSAVAPVSVPPRLSDEAAQWLATGDRGMSSACIFEHTTGMRICGNAHERIAHPHDPGDLKRCQRLVDSVPECEAFLRLMPDVSPIWAALIEVWFPMLAILDEEVPDWRNGATGSAPRCFEMMRETIRRAGS